MLSMDVSTTSPWQASGRLMLELNVSTVPLHIMEGMSTTWGVEYSCQ